MLAVIGAGGHVGLPFSLVQSKYDFVIGIDTNEKVVDMLNHGKVPFVEKGAEDLLEDAMKRNAIAFTTDFSWLENPSVDKIAIMIGTPMDEEGNPRTDDIFKMFKDHLEPLFQKNPGKEYLVLLRSTVTPGTTELLRCNNVSLVYAPERVAQGVAIEESEKFPQLIGTHNGEDEKAFWKASDLFPNQECIHLTYEEAEIAKLVTNMYRYINFAFANEVFMISEKYGADAQKLIRAANKDYPRMNMPLPGFSAGACLAKDGKFLKQEIPYSDLISAAYEINEGLPSYILSLLDSVPGDSILLLGKSFKADSDDIRLSLSYKMKKLLENRGYNVVMYDPYHDDEFPNIPSFRNLFTVIMMTPHKEFLEREKEIQSKLWEGTLIIDIWKHWEESKNSPNGVYYL